MIKYLKMDFFRIDMPPGSTGTFEGLIRQVHESPNDESRARTVAECPVRMQEGHRSRELWEFDMLKIRMTEVSPKAKTNGEVTPIEMDEDEGLGELTAAIYHVPTSTLVINRNHYGLSASRVAAYFEKIGELDDSISLVPISARKAWERLESLGCVRTLEIATTGFGSIRLDEADETSVIDLAKACSVHGARNSYFKFSMGHAPGTLTNVMNTVRKVFGLNINHEVTKILVTGANNDDEKTVIDLLKDRLKATVPVSIEQGEYLTYAKRRRAVLEAWQEKKEEILELALI